MNVGDGATPTCSASNQQDEKQLVELDATAGDARTRYKEMLKEVQYKMMAGNMSMASQLVELESKADEAALDDHIATLKLNQLQEELNQSWKGE